jgi:curved DNA-binding protein CbpA
MAQFKDFYKILGVPSDAKLEEIKKAYRQLVQDYSSDKFMNEPKWVQEASLEKMKEINEAWYILKDPIKRKKYDKDTVIEKPKPEVDKSYILFDDVTPGEVKTDSFILINSGGDYNDIYVYTQNPNSWLKIVGTNSLDPNQSDELPLKIVIEASVDEWGRNYIEYIIVKLDDEEIKVRAELNTVTKKESIKKVKVKATQQTIPRNNVLSWRYSKLLVWTGTIASSLIVLILLIIFIVSIFSFNSEIWTPGFIWFFILIFLVTFFIASFGSFVINKTKNFRVLTELENEGGQAGAVFVMIIGGTILLANIVLVAMVWFAFLILISGSKKD